MINKILIKEQNIGLEFLSLENIPKSILERKKYNYFHKKSRGRSYLYLQEKNWKPYGNQLIIENFVFTRFKMNSSGDSFITVIHDNDPDSEFSKEYVKVFKYLDGLWVQKGSLIYVNDGFGTNISMNSEGNIISVATPQFIKSYIWDESINNWKQLGQTILPSIDEIGLIDNSLSINGLGNIISICIESDQNYIQSYIFNQTSYQWEKYANPLNLFDDKILKIRMNKIGNIMITKGIKINIFKLNQNNWTQLGQSFNSFEVVNVDIDIDSTGNTIIIGDNKGSVVYYLDLNSNNWKQKGQGFTGNVDMVEISDSGNSIMIGTLLSIDEDPDQEYGVVKIYNWNGLEWIQKGSELEIQFLNLARDSELNSIIIGGSGTSGDETDDPGNALGVFKIN